MGIEPPLALPGLLAGARTSVIINIGTATSHPRGSQELGSPIIVGLAGFNTVCVIPGALVVGLLTIVSDLPFDRANRRFEQWRRPR